MARSCTSTSTKPRLKVMCTSSVSTCPLLWQLSTPYTVAGCRQGDYSSLRTRGQLSQPVSRLGQPFCQSALAQMNFLPLSLERVVVDEFKSRIFSPHLDVDMFLPQLMEFERNLNRCVLKPMRLVKHFHVVLDS